MKTTDPFVLFSKGTTPRYALPDCTAENTSSMVIDGLWAKLSSGKVSSVALMVESGQLMTGVIVRVGIAPCREERQGFHIPENGNRTY